MQNLLRYYAPGIRSHTTFYAAKGNARTSYLGLRDIAVVAARTLDFTNGISGMTYEVSYVDILDEAQRAASMLQ